MKTAKREPLIESEDSLQKFLDQHAGTADCEVVAAILQLHPEALPCATYVLLHGKGHAGVSAVPELCPKGLRELVELLLAVGIETGLRLAGAGSTDGLNRWKIRLNRWEN